nr:hypothetical protein [Tanacetum cinerariifolium]
MADDEDECESPADEVVESGDISILNSLVGHGSIVERMGLPITTTKPFKVYIGSVESLLCESLCLHVSLQMQGLRIDVDLYVLPMKGPDVVLGIQWLQHLGKSDEVYGIYEAYNLATEEEQPINTQVVVASEHPEITQLLAHFESVGACVYCECMEPFKTLMRLWVRNSSIAAIWLEKVVTPLIVPAIKGFAAALAVLKPERLKVDKYGMSEPMSYYPID